MAVWWCADDILCRWQLARPGNALERYRSTAPSPHPPESGPLALSPRPLPWAPGPDATATSHQPPAAPIYALIQKSIDGRSPGRSNSNFTNRSDPSRRAAQFTVFGWRTFFSRFFEVNANPSIGPQLGCRGTRRTVVVNLCIKYFCTR